MKKLIALSCAAAMLLSTSLAQTFSDLPETHWAQKVVEEMVEQKIISGYTDGTFRPSKNISKIESLILLARIAGINNYPDAANKYLETYYDTLSKYTTQYKKDVAYLLGTKVLETSDLDNLLSADQVNAPITREEMAVLITKVMGKAEEVKSKSLIILPFADASSITPSAKPYVYYVSTEKIMAGVDSENFSPKTNVTRAQAACILQRIYKKVDIKPDTSNNSSNSNTSTGKVTVLNGTITKIDTTLKTVFIKDSSGNTEEYEYDSSTEFYVNSTKKTSSEMEKGLTVTVTLKDSTYITMMKMTKDVITTVSGTISDFDTSKKTVTVTKNAKKTTYNYTSSTKFYLDGKTSTASSALKKNYSITLTVENEDTITKIETKKATATEETIIGKITKADDDEGYLIIEDDDGEKYTLMDDYIDEYSDNDEDYYFDDDTKFTYNGSSKTYKSIATTSYLYKKGYYVKITVDKNDYLTKIEVASKKSEFTSSEETIIGKITKADDDEGYIIIEDDDGEKYTLMDDYIDEYSDGDEDYYFDDDTDFTYNGSSKSYKSIATTSYLYKKGYYVKITMDKNDYLTKIEVASKESTLTDDETPEKIVGEIVEVGKSDGYLIIEDEDGKEYVLMDDYLGEYDEGDEDYYFDNKTTFSYNAVSKTYSAVSTTSYLYKKGLFLRLTLDDDDYIEKIELAAKESAFNSSSSSSSNIDDGYVFGYITELYDDELVIEDDDGEEYSFEIADDCVIIERSSDDPEGDLYYYADDYEDVLDEDDEVVVFVYKEKSSKYYTSLIILMD
ncbi:MAG: S-layer homology domain-containing protein [Clostridia bacterium]|nr:S-layer homology domain-containing protein [Clostridia bacterium]